MMRKFAICLALLTTTFCGMAMAQATTMTYGGKQYTLSATSNCPGGGALRYQSKWWCPVPTMVYNGKQYTLSTTSNCPGGGALRYQSQWWCPTNATAPVTYTARLSWTIPSTRANGTPLALSELAGYEIYYTSSLSGVSGVVAVNGAGSVGYALANLAAGSYYFTISAIDTSGLKSPMSSMVTATFGK